MSDWELLQYVWWPRAHNQFMELIAILELTTDKITSTKTETRSGLVVPRLNFNQNLKEIIHLQDSEELFETVAQCLLSGVDRDALSGWGGIVYIV